MQQLDQQADPHAGRHNEQRGFIVAEYLFSRKEVTDEQIGEWREADDVDDEDHAPRICVDNGGF
ncbi:hypothetical protein DESC_700170 [Desulfosarcina cetonica]|nr:hypothetical protein [Desulfosarcina cetonica]VTR68414.1 hypothetical protein DESC_700170 [Desulfosarcina cetonica]